KKLKPTITPALTYKEYREKTRRGEQITLGDNNFPVISADRLNCDHELEKRRFNCKIYEISGANGINIYNDKKTDEAIINEHIEKLNFNGKAWIDKNHEALNSLNIMPPNITAFDPIYDITWFSDKNGSEPVFSIKLKLQLS